jgi:hypothetical protein
MTPNEVATGFIEADDLHPSSSCGACGPPDRFDKWYANVRLTEMPQPRRDVVAFHKMLPRIWLAASPINAVPQRSTEQTSIE